MGSQKQQLLLYHQLKWNMLPKHVRRNLYVVCQLLLDFETAEQEPILLLKTDQGCIKLAQLEVVSSRMKHIDVKYQWVRDKQD